jgi:hypothetical protein
VKLQRLCDAAYKSKSVIEHVVIENNFDWNKFMEPLVLSKETYSSGMLKVLFIRRAMQK